MIRVGSAYRIPVVYNGKSTRVPNTFVGKVPVLPYTSGGISRSLSDNSVVVYYPASNESVPYTSLTGYGNFINPNGYFMFPSTTGAVILNNAGLTLATANTSSRSCVRLTASSLKTSYVNVYRWVAFELKTSSTKYRTDINPWEWNNSTGMTLSNVEDATVHEYNTSKTIDGKPCVIACNYATCQKKSNTYMKWAFPMVNTTSGGVARFLGYGIVLEPTNSNDWGTP